MAKTIPGWVSGALGLVAALGIAAQSSLAFAATHRYDVLFDLDRNATTGCSAGAAVGIERIVRVTLDTTTTAATVSAISQLDCSGNAFGAPQALSGAPYGLTLAGAGGTPAASAIELSVPLAGFPANPVPSQPMIVRLGATSSAAGNSSDAILPLVDYQLRSAVPNSVGASAEPIPVAGIYLIAALALALGALGAKAIKQRAGVLASRVFHSLAMFGVVGVIGLGAGALVYAIVLDGNVGDWSGSSPIATDARGDQPANADLVALYAKNEGSDLALRIDAVIALEPVVVGNLPPVISGLSDQTITLPTYAIALAPSVTDDGMPAPATLNYQWQRISGPQTVVFGNDASTPPDLSSAAAAAAAQTSTRKDVGAFFDLNTSGTYVLRFTASDGALSSSRDVTVTVNPAASAAPAIGPLADRTVRLGETLTISLAGRDVNVADSLTYALPTAPAGASLSPAGTARFTFTPTAAQIGAHPVTIRVSDSSNQTAQASFTVTVAAANRPPRFTAASRADAASSVGAVFARTLLAIDPDTPETLTYSLVEGPAGMTVAASGALSWSPNTTQRGENTVKVEVRDSAGARDVALFTLNVGNNAAPVARTDTYHVRVGETLTVTAATGVLANDIDPDGNPMTAIKMSDPDKGTLSAVNADGSFTYTAPDTLPAAQFAVRKKYTIPRNGYNWNGLNVGDVNGDGAPDILISFQGGYAAYSGVDGSQLWSRGGEFGDFFGHTSGGTVLADVDDDGELEFIAYYSSGNRPREDADGLFAMNARTGATKWLGPSLTPEIADVLGGGVPVEGALERTGATVARLYADQKPKFLLRRNILSSEGFYTRTDNTNVSIGCMALTGREADRGRACRATFIVNHLGQTEEVLTAPNPNNEQAWYANGNGYHGRVIVADLDGDGAPELISGGDVFKRVAGAWTLSWTVPWQPQNAAVADLDGDGTLEVIHAYQYHPTNEADRPNGLYVYSQNGTLVRKIMVGHLSAGGFMTVADIDGDASPDILVYNYGVMQALRADGRPLWIFRAPKISDTVPPLTDPPPAGLGRDARITRESTEFSFRNVPVVYDLDGDGIKEVVFWTPAGTMFLDGRSGRQKAVYGLSGGPNGGNVTYEATIVADVNNDGRVEIITSSSCPYSLFISEYQFCDGQTTVLESASGAWMPGPKSYAQLEFAAGQIDDNGHVNYQWPTRNSYRTQIQQGVVRDPRLAEGTVFTYKANDGALDSATTDVFVKIAPQNSPPVFTSVPPSAHFADSAAGYPREFYTARAVDPDPGDTVRYELVAGNPFSIPTTIDPVTGVMRQYTGSCGSFGGPCNFGWVLNIIAAVDSFGARTEQAFWVFIDSTVVSVPNVVGQSLETARATLEAVPLRWSILNEVFDAAPAGTVIAQSITPGTPNISRNATIPLTVSKGPAPVVVPNVVGLADIQARARLETAGFTVSLVRQFSTTVQRSVVLDQSIAAGREVIPGSIEIVVSAGNGLRLLLNREVMCSDSSITATPESFDLNGQVVSNPVLNYTIEPVHTDYTGPLPTISNNVITAGATTRGVFKLRGVDSATSRQAEREFVVLPPAALVWEEVITRLTEIEALGQPLIDARDRNDVPAMTNLVQQLIAIWTRPLPNGGTLGDSLPGATLLQTENGFPPSACQQRSFPRNPSADDLLHRERNAQVNQRIRDLIQNLRDPNGSRRDFEININALRESVLSLRNLQGYTDAASGLADIAELQWAASTGTDRMVNGLLEQAQQVINRSRTNGLQSSTKTNLIELSITTTVTALVNTMADQTYGPIKQTVYRALRQAAFSGAAMVARNWLRTTLKGLDIQGVVTGASQSFHVFEAGNSFIEIPGCAENPANYDVLFIGPDLLESMVELIEKVKEGASFDRNEFTNMLRWQNPFGRDLIRNDISKRLNEIKGAVNGVADVVIAAWQGPDESDFGCIFSADAACQQLVFGDGIAPVYTLKYGQNPPLPAAILTLVFDRAYGDVYLGTPLFFPVRKGLFQ